MSLFRHPERQFALSLRGYDRDQVDAYVERQEIWMQAWREGTLDTTGAEERPFFSAPESMPALGERVGRILQTVVEAAEEMRAEAAEEIARMRREAADEVERARRETAQEVERARREATEEGERAAEAARAEAAGVLEQTKAEAEQLRTRLEGERRNAQAEIRALVERRDAVVTHLDQLQRTLAGVLGVVGKPGVLQGAPAVGLGAWDPAAADMVGQDWATPAPDDESVAIRALPRGGARSAAKSANA